MALWKFNHVLTAIDFGFHLIQNSTAFEFFITKSVSNHQRRQFSLVIIELGQSDNLGSSDSLKFHLRSGGVPHCYLARFVFIKNWNAMLLQFIGCSFAWTTTGCYCIGVISFCSRFKTPFAFHSLFNFISWADTVFNSVSDWICMKCNAGLFEFLVATLINACHISWLGWGFRLFTFVEVHLGETFLAWLGLGWPQFLTFVY